jgi:hypothetical protein
MMFNLMRGNMDESVNFNISDPSFLFYPQLVIK